MQVPSRGTSLNGAAAAAAISAAAAVAQPAGRPAANSLRTQPAPSVDTAGGSGCVPAPSSAAAGARPATNGARGEGHGGDSGGAVADLETNGGPAIANGAPTGACDEDTSTRHDSNPDSSQNAFSLVGPWWT